MSFVPEKIFTLPPPPTKAREAGTMWQISVLTWKSCTLTDMYTKVCSVNFHMSYFHMFCFLATTECTKIARSSAAAAAIFTAPPQNRAIFKAPRCAISSAKKIASGQRFSLRFKGPNLIPTAEFPAIPESAAKIASERRCAILVHSGPQAQARQGRLGVALQRAPPLLTRDLESSLGSA